MLKNFLKLFSGSAISQAIQMIALLYLTSLYLPEEFGKLGKIQSFASILSLYITLQMNHVIPLSKSEEYANTLTTYVFKICILNFFLSFILLLFIPPDYSWGIVLSLILALNNTISGYIIFRGEFSVLSYLFIARALFIVGFQLLFSFLKIENGLLNGAIGGELLGFLFLFFVNRNKIKFNLKYGRETFKKIETLIIEWKTFSLHGTIQEFLSAAVYALPMIYYVEKFGENVGGQYSIAFKIIYAPTVLVSSSLTKVLYNKFAKKEGLEFLNNYIWFDKRILILLLGIMLLLFNINSINIPSLFDNWGITLLLLPYIFVNAMFFLYASPFRIALRTLKLNKEVLKIELITLVLITALFWFLDTGVLNFTIAITVVGVIQNLLIALTYKKYEKNLG